jgi:hypothetical protein
MQHDPIQYIFFKAAFPRQKKNLFQTTSLALALEEDENVAFAHRALAACFSAEHWQILFFKRKEEKWTGGDK